MREKMLDEAEDNSDESASKMTTKFNIHLQSNGRNIGSVEIENGFEEYLVNSTFVEMFLCKEEIEEKAEMDVVDKDAVEESSKNPKRRSNFDLLKEDLECSSSSEDEDSDSDGNLDDDSDSDTSSSDEEDEYVKNVDTGNTSKNNNNDENPSVTISSDSEGNEAHKVINAPKMKKFSISDRFKLFYNNYEGEGKKRKVRCKLCPGNHVMLHTNFHRHIKEVHEPGRARRTCEVCHKDYSSSYIRHHKKTCQEKSNWSQLKFNEVN